jgi:hypothetical protein
VHIKKQKEVGNEFNYLTELFKENKELAKGETSDEEEEEMPEDLKDLLEIAGDNQEKPKEEPKEQPNEELNEESDEKIQPEEPIKKEENEEEINKIKEIIEKTGIPIIEDKWFIAPNYQAEYIEEEIPDKLEPIRLFPAYEAASIGVNTILKRAMRTIEEIERRRRKEIRKNKKYLDYSSFSINFNK